MNANLADDLQYIPPELAAEKAWCVWRYENRKGKRTKVPCRPDGSAWRSNDPTTWVTFAEAEGAAFDAERFDGFGTALHDDYVGVDVDWKHATPEELNEDGIPKWLPRVLTLLASYTEKSPSGKGVHILLRGEWRGQLHQLALSKGVSIEVYDRKSPRYFTVTGSVIAGSPYTIRSGEGVQAALDQLAAELTKRSANQPTEDEQPPDLEGAPEGQRRAALTSEAGRLRALRLSYAEASVLLLALADRCTPPAPHADAIEILDWAWSKPGPEDPLERAVRNELLRRQARRIADERERGPVEQFEVATLLEHLAKPQAPTPWRVAEWQPQQSRVILAAQFKAGKTTAVGNLVRSLLDGDPWLGKYPVTPVDGTVALLDFEMSGTQLTSWLRDQGVQKSDRLLLVPMRGRASAFNLQSEDVRARWATLLKSGRVGYLILDCLRPIMDGLSLDEHHDAGRFLVNLDELLREAEIADCLVVHHMGHANERSRGDSRLRDWPDVEWRLVRKDADPGSARFITAYGRDVDVEEQELGYDAANRRLTIVGGSRRDTRVLDALPAILTFIRDEVKPPSRNQIVASLKGSEHADNIVKSAIKRGIQEGKIAVALGKKRAQLHSITPKGEAFLAHGEEGF